MKEKAASLLKDKKKQQKYGVIFLAKPIFMI